MSGSAVAFMRSPVTGVPRRPGGTGVTTTRLDPLQQRVLELQRDAGNAAVAQAVGQAGGATDSIPEDPAAASQARAAFDQGAAAYDRGEFGKAYDLFTRAFELSPRPGLVFSRAQALRRQGARSDEAIALYQQYLALGETKRAADATRFIGELQAPESKGDVVADTASGRAMFETGARMYERGDFAHAYDEFTKAFELTHRPGLLFSRAQALRRLGGRRQEAIELYEAYIALGDGARDAEASRFITELSTPESTGDLDKDVELGRSIFEKGAKLYEAGAYGHAYDEFTRSYELTERPGLLFSRAQALRRLGGRRDEAMALYEQYIDAGEGTRTADARVLLEELRTKGTTK